MGRIHIRKLSLQAFRAFKDKNTTKTLPRTGLVGIRGSGPNGVSSGTGKSSIGLAITYAFGYCPFSANAQQNWHTKTPMQVELELDTHLGPALLKRGKEFSLTVNGVTTQGSAKLVEAEVQKLVGLPIELLETLTYRQQQERGRFLKMTDGKKREFLSTLLNVTELEEEIEKSVKKSNELQKEVDALDKVICALEEVLVQPGELKLKDVTELKNELDIKSERYNSELRDFEVNKPIFSPPSTIISELESKINECNRRVLLLENKERIGKTELTVKSKQIQSEIHDIDVKYAFRDSYLKQIQNLENENRKLSDAICNVCHRPWERAEERLLLNEEKIRNLRVELEKIVESQKVKFELTDQLNKLQKEIAEFKVPNLDIIKDIKLELEKQLSVEKNKSEEAQEKFDNQLSLAKNKVKLAKAEYDAAKRALELTESENTAILIGYNNSVKRYEREKTNLHSNRLNREQQARKASEEYDFADSLRKYLTSLFDQILSEISLETNEYLKGLPNTPTTTILFTTETQTEKNGVKQEIKPLVMKGGQAVDLKSGISGGQLESVELAVDLAIGKVIGERTGVRPGFIIFDESFGAHCPVVKQSCMEILKRASEDCLILVIDHATELRDYFDDFVDVESNGDESRIINL